MATTMTKEKNQPMQAAQPEVKTRLLSQRPGAFSSFLGRAPFWSLRDEMDQLLSRFSDEWNSGWLTQGFEASLDLSETDDKIEVHLDVPGIRPEEIDVEVSGNQLRITGERKEDREEKGKTYHRVERHSGSFSRTVTLPCEVKEAAIEACCDNGVLTISLPKAETVKAHKVTVKPKAK